MITEQPLSPRLCSSRPNTKREKVSATPSETPVTLSPPALLVFFFSLSTPLPPPRHPSIQTPASSLKLTHSSLYLQPRLLSIQRVTLTPQLQLDTRDRHLHLHLRHHALEISIQDRRLAGKKKKRKKKKEHHRVFCPHFCIFFFVSYSNIEGNSVRKMPHM